jgi:hypothetical protein
VINPQKLIDLLILHVLNLHFFADISPSGRGVRISLPAARSAEAVEATIAAAIGGQPPQEPRVQAPRYKIKLLRHKSFNTLQVAILLCNKIIETLTHKTF